MPKARAELAGASTIREKRWTQLYIQGATPEAAAHEANVRTAIRAWCRRSGGETCPSRSCARTYSLAPSFRHKVALCDSWVQNRRPSCVEPVSYAAAGK